ncbi:MAG: hypothetical protein J0H08_07950, partial [Rhizobiales bacterium]|nr:hypothetical protein [Hyphomicrobiales bacterium]
SPDTRSRGSPAAGVAELIPGRYTFFQTQVAGIRLGGSDDGEPRAISYLNNGLVAVLFVRQDASGPVGSIRTWGRSRDDVLEPSTWTEGPTILYGQAEYDALHPSRSAAAE